MQAFSISICLSKGLGAPAGSLLEIPKDLAKNAVYVNLLEDLRQSGLLAAAGIYALDNNIERLNDHARAQNLKNELCQYFGNMSEKRVSADEYGIF